MDQTKLYSIAAVAKLLDVPESTLHYWKNRFDASLPSIGRGRGRRFRPEAVEVFRTIAGLLESGLSAADVRAELARRFPVNVTPEAGPEPLPPTRLSPAEDLAGRIGIGIAEAVAQRMRELMALPGQTPGRDVQELKDGLGAAQARIETLQAENEDLVNKLRVLEAELVRLRKDGRENQKHLLEKIRALGHP